MAKSSPWGNDANRFRPRIPPRCAWRDCDEMRFDDTPVCIAHALIVKDRVQEQLKQSAANIAPWTPPQFPSYVYYLMVGPATVKIGTTANLPQRLGAMRTDVQYVVAIERGGFEVERKRHRQFAAERVGRREDFILSDPLKAHIDSLVPQRDKLILAAMAPTKIAADA